MDNFNSYEDAERATAYDKLEFPGTYYLAYRDLPAIIFEHVKGRKAIDFGCGTGRSTRFLQRLGFEIIGINISEEMIRKARERDPKGDYRLVADAEFGKFNDQDFDLVLSAFTFDNIPTLALKVKLFSEIANLLTNDGRIVNLVSSPDIYIHEWASFSTKDFPENKFARCGDKVKIIIIAIDDKRPVEDIIWPDENYQKVYQKAAFAVVKTYQPLAYKHEPYAWVNETKIAPWVIYVLRKN